MSQITGGRVTYGRTVQPAQYESKKAEVEISFVIGEGEELGEMLDRAALLAETKALELVGLRKTASITASSTPPAPGTNGGKEAYAATQKAAEAPKPDEPKRRPGRPPNPDKLKVVEEAPDVAEMVDEPSISSQAEAIARAKAKVAAAQKVADDAAAAAKEAAELAEMVGDDAPALDPITDKQLIEKIGHKNKSLADKNAGIPQPRKIKELIAKYATHAHSIPAEKRAEFLEKLDELA